MLDCPKFSVLSTKSQLRQMVDKFVPEPGRLQPTEPYASLTLSLATLAALSDLILEASKTWVTWRSLWASRLKEAAAAAAACS